MVEFLQQTSQDQEIGVAEERTTSSDVDKGIVRTNIGPRGWKGMETVIRQMEEDPIFTPVMPIEHQLELAPVQWMEGVRYLKGFRWTVPIRCS